MFERKSDAKVLEEQLVLGNCYLEKLDYEKAVVYQETLRINPRNEDAYIGLVDVYTRMGDYESALAVLETGYGEVASGTLALKREEVKRCIWNGRDKNLCRIRLLWNWKQIRKASHYQKNCRKGSSFPGWKSAWKIK